MNLNWKRISKSLLLVLGMPAVSPVLFAQPVFPVDFKNHFAAVVFDDARDLFNAGQGLYDEGRFLDAESKFRQVIQRFPKSAIADRADYYLIRTLKQLDRKSEALARIDSFAKTYPRSRWLNDVQELRINLTNQIPPAAELVLLRQAAPPPVPPSPSTKAVPAPPAPPNFVFQNQQLQERVERLQQRAERFQRLQHGRNQDDTADPEMSLQQEIMRAVFFNNAERAIEIATERLKSDPADPVVLSNLNMIAVSRSARALPTLLAIAKNSTNVKARKDAIFWISQSNGDKDVVVDTLLGILPSAPNEESDALVFALGQIRSEKSLNALAAIARDKSKTEKARNNAIFWIGQSNSPLRASLLEDIYKASSDNAKLRIQTLFALSQTRDPRSVTLLGNIASTDPDVDVRRQAVFWLGQMKSPEAAQALENLLKK